MANSNELREERKKARRIALGRRIYQKRKSARMTQEKVASLLGWSRTTLVAMETGLQATSVDQLYELADLLNYDIKDFLEFSLEVLSSKPIEALAEDELFSAMNPSKPVETKWPRICKRCGIDTSFLNREELCPSCQYPEKSEDPQLPTVGTVAAAIGAEPQAVAPNIALAEQLEASDKIIDDWKSEWNEPPKTKARKQTRSSSSSKPAKRLAAINRKRAASSTSSANSATRPGSSKTAATRSSSSKPTSARSKKPKARKKVK